MTEPSELVERLAAVVDPRFSAEFVGNIVRANWPDIHAALCDPLAMAKALEPFARYYALNDCDERTGAIEVPIADLKAAHDTFAAIDPATLEVNHATD